MMRYMVYAEYDEDQPDMHFFETRLKADAFVNKLLAEAKSEMADLEGWYPNWASDITVFEVVATVQQIPFDGRLQLRYVK